ncbi:DnaD domain-containing protein [Virgibacillus salexigens]|uniref:DnaD domain-containing protein n=1 Tax=Virgibacillus salexigens TaxID=61016 RepID=UPI003081D89B
MKGAFQTSREIFENPIWNDIPKFRIFFYIYGNAVFSKEGTTVAGMHLKRGQFLRSYRNLREDLSYVENRSVKKYSLSVIKNKIDQLVKENRLKIEGVELGTLFTVVNYELYQGLDNYRNQNLERSENGERTQSERSENNNKNVKNDKELFSSSNEQEFAEVFQFYQSNLQKGVSESPYNTELISQWFDEWGQDLLMASMKVAAKAEAKGVSMIEGILKNWKEAGVKTLEDARKYETDFKAKKTNNTIPFKPKRIKEAEDDGYNYGF